MYVDELEIGKSYMSKDRGLKFEFQGWTEDEEPMAICKVEHVRGGRYANFPPGSIMRLRPDSLGFEEREVDVMYVDELKPGVILRAAASNLRVRFIERIHNGMLRCTVTQADAAGRFKEGETDLFACMNFGIKKRATPKKTPEAEFRSARLRREPPEDPSFEPLGDQALDEAKPVETQSRKLPPVSAKLEVAEPDWPKEGDRIRRKDGSVVAEFEKWDDLAKGVFTARLIGTSEPGWMIGVGDSTIWRMFTQDCEMLWEPHGEGEMAPWEAEAAPVNCAYLFSLREDGGDARLGMRVQRRGEPLELAISDPETGELLTITLEGRDLERFRRATEFGE